MRRREFITLIGGAATSWPLTAIAQQIDLIPIIGYLSGRSAADSAQVVAAFRSGLAERGYTDGKNVTIQFRFADGHYYRLPALANDLVQSNVAAIIATGGGAPSGRAAEVATTTIPIVFVVGGDPIEFGLVSSINRPEGNATGIAFLINELIPKQIEVLAEAVPAASAFGFLVNPTSPYAQTNTQSAEQAAQKFGRRLLVAAALSPNDFENAYSRLAAERVGGLLIASEPTFNGRDRELATLSAARDPNGRAATGISPCRRTNELRHQHHRCPSASWNLRGSHSFRGQTLRSTSAAISEDRPHCESEDS
jgi:putative ABC transport system substrate-binding protein